MLPAITVRDGKEQAASPKESIVHSEAMNVLLVSKAESAAGYLCQQLESRGAAAGTRTPLRNWLP